MIVTLKQKGKKIRVKDEIEPQHPQSNVCLVISFKAKKEEQ